MKVLDAILNVLRKNGGQDQNDVPEGFCPNCWGRNEYGGQFYDAVKNNHTDINSPNPNIGWIQDYANKYLSDIQLQIENKQLVCQKCKLTYRPE